MKRTRCRSWPERLVILCITLSVLILAIDLLSVAGCLLYQQPPGITVAPISGQPGAAIAITPAGRVRVRLLAGSLIVANGDLPPNITVGTTLGYMRNAGWMWSWNSAGAMWNSLTAPNTWKYRFYRQHVQVQLLPIALMLLCPWLIRYLVRKARPAWVCPDCGYDRRGTPEGPCPECGSTPRLSGLLTSSPTGALAPSPPPAT